MLDVSPEFLETMLKPGRVIHPRVTIGYTDPFLDQSIQVTVSEGNRSGAQTQVCDGKSTPGGKFASFEPGKWKLGQGFGLAPGNQEVQIGWRGTTLSSSTATFSSPYPTLTVDFVSRPLDELRVVGDSINQEYPVNFTIRVYSGSTLVKTQTVTDNAQVDWSVTFPALTQITRLELAITKWSAPHRFVKILEFFSSIQEVYSGEEVLGLSLVEERGGASGLAVGTIASSEVEIQLNNSDRRFDAGNVASPVYQLLKPNRRVSIELGLELPGGGVEYVPFFQGWTQEWKVPEDDILATTVARDRLETLQNTLFDVSPVYTSASVAGLVETLLLHAGVTNYWIDPDLEEIILPYAFFSPVTHREALRLLMGACGGQVYCARSGQVRVEGPQFLETHRKTSVLTITGDHYFTKDNPALWAEVSNVVEVPVTPLQADVLETVYEDTEDRLSPTPETLILRYPEVPVVDAQLTIISGHATISSLNYYAWGATATVQGSGPYRLAIEGRVLRPAGSIVAVARDEKSIRENGVLTLRLDSNPLVQTVQLGQSLAESLLAVATEPRRDITLDWIGHLALELGDRITAPDFADRGRDYHITRQEWEFDGSLSGRLKGRFANGLDTPEN